MDKCMLVKPDVSFENDIAAFRQEMLDAGSSMDGTGPLKRMDNIAEWLEITRSLESKDTVPSNWVTCDQYIYVRETDHKIIGMIQFRHYLNDFLEKYGLESTYYAADRDEERIAIVMMAIIKEARNER